MYPAMGVALYHCGDRKSNVLITALMKVMLLLNKKVCYHKQIASHHSYNNKTLARVACMVDLVKIFLSSGFTTVLNFGCCVAGILCGSIPEFPKNLRMLRSPPWDKGHG